MSRPVIYAPSGDRANTPEPMGFYAPAEKTSADAKPAAPPDSAAYHASSAKGDVVTPHLRRCMKPMTPDQARSAYWRQQPEDKWRKAREEFERQLGQLARLSRINESDLPAWVPPVPKPSILRRIFRAMRARGKA